VRRFYAVIHIAGSISYTHARAHTNTHTAQSTAFTKVDAVVRIAQLVCVYPRSVLD